MYNSYQIHALRCAMQKLSTDGTTCVSEKYVELEGWSSFE